MALEPLHNQKAAVVSLFVQLPGGDEDFTPSGTSGLAIGSALISIGKFGLRFLICFCFTSVITKADENVIIQGI